MKTTIIDYKKIVDVDTFQPKVQVTLEWLVEHLQDAQGGHTEEEQYAIIGRSISEAIKSFEPVPMVWNNYYTREELKDALKDAGIVVYDDMPAPTCFPTKNGVSDETIAIAAKTMKIDDTTLGEVVEKLKKTGNNFSLYKLMLPRYHKEKKIYIWCTEEEYDIIPQDDISFSGLRGGLITNHETGEPQLFGKIRFASW
jgi:hypothetical protein